MDVVEERKAPPGFWQQPLGSCHKEAQHTFQCTYDTLTTSCAQSQRSTRPLIAPAQVAGDRREQRLTHWLMVRSATARYALKGNPSSTQLSPAVVNIHLLAPGLSVGPTVGVIKLELHSPPPALQTYARMWEYGHPVTQQLSAATVDREFEPSPAHQALCRTPELPS